MMRVSVLVPTYRRPADLERCLIAIGAQTRPPDEVIVVCREDDAESRAVLAAASIDVSVVFVHIAGVVAALNSGLGRLTGDVVAITDDDAAPRPDWLERIEAHFAARADLGGLGGRDYVHGARPERETTRVGIIEWYGRQIGSHHLGVGAPREVDMLKGVNMSFRRRAIDDVRFDERLRGSGAQVHNELAFCLAVRQKGWLLIYDPAVAVDHFPAPRFDEDQRSEKSQLAASNAAFNETLILLEHLPPLRQAAFLAWAMGIGARDLPGVIQALRLLVRKDRAWMLLPAALKGRCAAVKAHYSRPGFGSVRVEV